MPQNAKLLAKKINKSLDDVGAPANMRERSVVFSKMLHIPKQQAWGLLEGQIFPQEDLLEKIATELEIDISQLLKNNA